ncbi:inorganic phosphate transporter [Natronococcus wangiae]|uniref:inorganic phosphate transporter n=1 Tax=Natronococcus wangiae TaxID=3068275 RepID=UPI00273F0976|nr:inorganic phosphate transporter [Natronococcus sp. AD5]
MLDLPRTGAPRLIEAVAEEYATLSPNRAIAALVPAFIVAQIGIQYGVPVSFNEIIISAIIGSGLAMEEGITNIDRRKVYFTVAAWIVSLVGAFLTTYVLVSVVGDAGVP